MTKGKTVFAILSVLEEHKDIASSGEVAEGLRSRGITISDRTVRYYLKLLEKEGYTTRGNRGGKKLTETGRQQLKGSFVAERVGSTAIRMNNLGFASDFDIERLTGRVVLNIAWVDEEKTEAAMAVLPGVLNSPYSMGNRIIIGGSGQRLGEITVPDGALGIGTVSSVTVNGVFLKAGIPVYPKFGGIVEIDGWSPTRFSSVIAYEGSSIAPSDLFMRSGMTDVLGAVRNGKGTVLGSFQEIPEASFGEAQKLAETMRHRGFSSRIVFGQPGQLLLGVPASPNSVGVVVLDGLNPLAVLEEMRMSTDTKAMATLIEYSRMYPADRLSQSVSLRERGASVLAGHYDRKRHGEKSGYWSVFLEMQQSTL